MRYYAVGRSSTVMLLDSGEDWQLYTNGLPESLIERPGAHTCAVFGLASQVNQEVGRNIQCIQGVDCVLSCHCYRRGTGKASLRNVPG